MKGPDPPRVARTGRKVTTISAHDADSLSPDHSTPATMMYVAAEQSEKLMDRPVLMGKENTDGREQSRLWQGF